MHTGEDIVHTSSVFLSTSLEADGIRERIAAAGAAEAAAARSASIQHPSRPLTP